MNYKTLDVWQSARELATATCKLLDKIEKRRFYSLSNQIQRSAISVPANIAEGLGRRHLKERIQYLSISKGSLFELETLLIISHDLDLIDNDDYELQMTRIERCQQLLGGFARYLKKAK